MLGKKARVVGQTVLFACVVRTWRNLFRKRGGFPIQGLNYDAATLPVVRKTAPARATLLSAWQITSAICFLHSSSVASHRSGQRHQVAAGLLKTLGGFVGRFGVSHVFSSVVQSKCHRIYSAISATERNTFPAACASSIRRRMSFASKGR